MILSQVKGIQVDGIAAAVPSRIVNISETVSADERNEVERFMKKIGVKSFHKSLLKQTASDLCCAAAKELMCKKHINKGDIGVLIFVTQCPDYSIPSTACVLQRRLSLSKDCIAFDINLGCSGFSYGLNVITNLMNSSNVKKALLLCGDISTIRYDEEEMIRAKSHAARWLFGDAGTAILLGKNEVKENIKTISRTDGEGYKAIIKPDGNRHSRIVIDDTYMDEVAVFQFAINEVPRMLDEIMGDSGATPDDYDALVLHQANLYIMKNIAKRTGFSMDKTIVSIDEYGNTSSASIPLSIIKKWGEYKEEQMVRLLCCGYGVGLSWAANDFYLNTDNVLPLVVSDEYYDDGFVF